MRGLVFLTAALALSFSGGATAQSITAGALATHCSAAEGTEGKSVCTLIVKAFMDGFLEGVGKGVMGVYTYDPEVSAAFGSRPMKDMAPRIQQVNEKAACIQRVSVGALVDAFVQRVQADPALRGKNYREALTRTVVANYCPK